GRAGAQLGVEAVIVIWRSHGRPLSRRPAASVNGVSGERLAGLRKRGFVMTEAHPVLAGRRVRIRSGRPGDAERLRVILAEPSVAQWWGEPDPLDVIEEALGGDGEEILLVMEIDGQVAGGIQYSEENEPMYRHAGIDIYLGTRFQGRGAGTEA